jgi:hypothetical protein
MYIGFLLVHFVSILHLHLERAYVIINYIISCVGNIYIRILIVHAFCLTVFMTRSEISFYLRLIIVFKKDKGHAILNTDLFMEYK